MIITDQLSSSSLQFIMQQTQHSNSGNPGWNIANQYESLIPHVLANIVTVAVCLLCYDIYLLLDEYFHTMVFSILVGAAIKPLKDMFINKIIIILYGDTSANRSKSIGIVQQIKKSLIFESENSEKLDNEILQTQSQDWIAEMETKSERHLSPPRKNSGEGFNIVDKPKSAFKKPRNPKKAHKPKKVDIAPFVTQNSIQSNKSFDNQKKGGSDLPLTNLIFYMFEGEFFDSKDNQKISEAKAKQQTFLKVSKQIFNIIASACFFYFLKGLVGLLILLSLFIFDYLVQFIQRNFAYRLDPLVASLRASIEQLVSRDKMQKTISAMFSCCCIVILVIGLTASAIFSVYMMQRDFYRIKLAVEHSDFAKDLANYTRAMNLSEIINSSLVKSIQTGSVFEQINTVLQSRAMQITKTNKQCIRTLDSYTYNLLPTFFTTRACVIYSELESSSLKNYLNYLGSLAEICQSVLRFSFAQVFGVINYFFLFIFKAFIFFTTTYFIIQDFNIESSLMFIGKLFQKTGPEGSRQQVFAQQFVVEIKNIMLSSLFIAFSHFTLSWVMLDLFAITQFDFVVSVILGAMALVPVYRPWLGALVVSFGSYMFGYQHHGLHLISFMICYYLISNQIFAKAYASISVPSIFTNLSVILGIYSYGIIGVVYGPLILTIMKRVSHAFHNH